jgi:hypothetical protein
VHNPTPPPGVARHYTVCATTLLASYAAGDLVPPELAWTSGMLDVQVDADSLWPERFSRIAAKSPLCMAESPIIRGFNRVFAKTDPSRINAVRDLAHA